MPKHRVALIGLGQIADSHKEMLAKLPERCEIIGMFDTDAQTLEKRKQQWGYPAFPSLDALLAARPDVCWVMTPSKPRYEIFKACYAKGCHIFTEKPLALNNEDAERCVKLAREANRLLGFGCNNRHKPELNMMANLLFDGVLGSLIKVYAHVGIPRGDEFWAKKFQQPDAWRLTFEASGGRIFEFAIHEVNWVIWVGGQPRLVMGVHDAVSPTLAKNGLDDVVAATIKFDQGYGIVETIMAPGIRKGRRAQGIIGTKGECWYDESENMVRLVVPGDKRDEFLAVKPCPNRAEDFFNAIDEGRKPLNDDEAALLTTRVCCAFNESVRTGQTIRL